MALPPGYNILLALGGMAGLVGGGWAMGAPSADAVPAPAPAPVAVAESAASPAQWDLRLTPQLMLGSVAATAPEALASLPEIPAQGELWLTPRLMLHLALVRGADIQYSRLAAVASGHLARAEYGVFEPIAYASVRHEDRSRQRTAQELSSNIFTQNEQLLDEQVRAREIGIRGRMGLGGEMTVAYKRTARSNNLIEDAFGNTAKRDTEYDAAYTVSFKQPLLRGFGSDAVDADSKVAELEWAIGKQQFRQQVLRSGSDALAAYWQLYRASESLKLRQMAKSNALAALADVEARIASGRMAPKTIFEARGVVAARTAEIFPAEQGVSEAEAKIKNLLNLGAQNYRDLHLIPRLPPSKDAAPALQARPLEQALQMWPGYRIAKLKQEQGRVRLNFAENQKKPVLDVVASCSSTRLSYESRYSATNVFSSGHPDCYLGLNAEMPIGGNLRASEQHQAQRVRLIQSDVEIEAIRSTLANDLQLRERQLARAAEEVAEHRKDVAMRAKLLELEQTQFKFGLSPLGQVILRENELHAGQERLLDALARLELARVAVQVADGSLLDTHGVEWREE